MSEGGRRRVRAVDQRRPLQPALSRGPGPPGRGTRSAKCIRRVKQSSEAKDFHKRKQDGTRNSEPARSPESQSPHGLPFRRSMRRRASSRSQSPTCLLRRPEARQLGPEVFPCQRRETIVACFFPTVVFQSAVISFRLCFTSSFLGCDWHSQHRHISSASTTRGSCKRRSRRRGGRDWSPASTKSPSCPSLQFSSPFFSKQVIKSFDVPKTQGAGS